MRTDTILLMRRKAYATSPDRAGLALGAGLLLAGALAGTAAGATSPGPVVAAGAGMLAALLVMTVAGPLWLAFHNWGWRTARHAALAGFLSGFGSLLVAQVYAVGLAVVPADSVAGAGQALRWTSAVATSLFWALPAAAIGVVMWRIAYRRARP